MIRNPHNNQVKPRLLIIGCLCFPTQRLTSLDGVDFLAGLEAVGYGGNIQPYFGSIKDIIQHLFHHQELDKGRQTEALHNKNVFSRWEKGTAGKTVFV